MLTMPYQEGLTPLASLCQKAGSTLDEILVLEEDELEELSKEIVGNGVLEHARVLRQWRRCRMEEHLRKELQVELTNEGQGVEVPLLVPGAHPAKAKSSVHFANNDASRKKKSNASRKKQQQQQPPQQQDGVIGESWQEYLRKQIRVEIEETKPPPVSSVIAGTRTTASEFTDDYETFGESITLDPSLLSSDEEDEDLKTTYNPVYGVGAVASDVMEYLEDGISAFFDPELPKKKVKKKEKNFLEAGMDFFYAEEPKKKTSSRKKKKDQPKSFLEEGMGCFNGGDGRGAKENSQNKSKKKKKTRSRSFNRSKRQVVQPYELVPKRSLQMSKFRC